MQETRTGSVRGILPSQPTVGGSSSETQKHLQLLTTDGGTP